MGGGPALDGTTMSRLLCDCSLHRVLTKGRSAILDYGTATRTRKTGAVSRRNWALR